MARVNDGLGTTLTWGTTTTFALEKVSITPPAIEGGDPIDITHLENTEYMTKVFSTLKELQEFQFEAHMDDALYLAAPINSNELLTYTFPNGATFAFYGALRTIEPGEAVEGDKQVVTCTVAPSCFDGTDEVAPVFTAAP